MPEDPQQRLAPTGWRLPTLLAVCGVLLGLLVDQVVAGIPMVPWSAIPTLLLLVLAELFTGGRTRRRVRRDPGTEPMEPLSAARLLALAKASAVLAALAAGFFVGLVLPLVETLALPVHREVFLNSLGTAAASGLLLAAALYLEQSCRVPDDDRDDDASS
ncbi:DUF3180 family protein [Nocardiopsis xinjiangensis]|uniref:DUF3180 family protein n=1 Tax=Nocardiopsis xinjiangensis TaxID=124285 RepID=UPI0003477AAB|nr:DUF3180 family protein [Nocardiopsis xinjiangensis]